MVTRLGHPIRLAWYMSLNFFVGNNSHKMRITKKVSYVR